MTSRPHTFGPIGYAERPWRRDPHDVPPGGDIYQATPEERAAVVAAARECGITLFHAAHEREAVSLGDSLRRLGLTTGLTLSTTDGDALDRCPDTEGGAFDAVQRAIARKKHLLGVGHLDIFSLYDIRRDTHTPARLAGAKRALDAARAAGDIGQIGATCCGDYDALADMIETGQWLPEWAAVRFCWADTRATTRLVPVCQEHNIPVMATQTFAWAGGVSFTRFPNTWRLRNLTRNFTGISAGQAHLCWILSQPGISGALVSMQTAEQVRENVAAAQDGDVPPGIESMLAQFMAAVLGTTEGWQGLREDEQWEVRAAAAAYLEGGG